MESPENKRELTRGDKILAIIGAALFILLIAALCYSKDDLGITSAP